VIALTFSTESFVLGKKRERIWYTNFLYCKVIKGSFLNRRPGIFARMCFDKIQVDSHSLIFQGDGTEKPLFDLKDLAIVDGEALLPRPWQKFSMLWQMSHNMNVGVMDNRRGIIRNRYA
jgi:hypothetical protein